MMDTSVGGGLPLEGVRILEMGEVWAAPYCGLLLGMLGAEVIKVESIQRIARGNASARPGNPDYPDGDPGAHPWNRSANFNAMNRCKLSITLDLTRPAGVECLKELVGVSDALFTNYAFGVADKLGIGYSALRAVRPDLVMVLMPGYGNSGPYRRVRSMGMTIDAITGHSSLRGYPDLDPSNLTAVHHPDAVGGLTATFAVCVALHNRLRTGAGQAIDLSQAEAFMAHLGEVFLECQMTGHPPGRLGNRHPSMSPHGCYPCAGEDMWVAIAVRDDREWRAFAAVAAGGRLADDARFATTEGRLAHRDELDRAVAAWTATLDRYEVTTILQRHGVPAGPVLDCCGDTYDDPHLQARGFFGPVEHPEAGVHLLNRPPWNLTGAHPENQAPAPCLGQHNDYVLGTLLGRDADNLARLTAEQVIGTVPLEGASEGGVARAGRRG